MLDSTLLAQDIDQELHLNEAEETYLPEDSQNLTISFQASSCGTGSRYPLDGKEFMRKNGPIDEQYAVPDADLIILERRDVRFYYVYRLRTPHPHIELNEIMPNASKYEQKKRFEFEETLSVPIGPDSLMDELGAYSLC
ncbi:hypothetical protein K443DRAFT_135423 [Laccaria amethystina LaAM-08-1]|uniref:Uncharacterized protein n=1 Tax=Laccaria amethystina LaAM-08-1 TaxID=1095629 RepID=A0A0C9WNB9_9AGAR|nr:hypothetical protein K443DRAFT_135423 [Laccaria amethystina LaAM-08-1]